MESLPLEVLQQIFRWATEIVGALDTSYVSPMDVPWDPDGEIFERKHWAAMETKRAIAQVSRDWRVIAARYLYETVLITAPQLPALATFLQTNSVRADHYLKRLHVHLGRRDDPTCAALYKIWPLCPNLKIFFIHFGYLDMARLGSSRRPVAQESVPILRKLFEMDGSPASTLHVLRCSNLKPRNRLEDLRVALGSLTSLRCLFIHLCEKEIIEVPPESFRRTSIHPEVHSLILTAGKGQGRAFLNALNWEFPSLRSLMLCGSRSLKCNFLVKHAPRLQVSSYPCPVPAKHTALDVILHAEEELLPPTAPPSFAHRLGITFPQSPSLLHCPGARRTWTHTMSTLLTALILSPTPPFPHLKIIRLLDAPRWALPKPRMNGLLFNFWIRWSGILISKGVKIESPDGKEIACLSKNPNGVVVCGRKMRGSTVGTGMEEAWPDMFSEDSEEEYEEYL